MKIKNIVIGGVFALLMGSVIASPLQITFSGTQSSDPFLFRGGVNEFGIVANQGVNGSFLFDTLSVADNYPLDNLRAQYANSVIGYQFQSAYGSNSQIGYSYTSLDSNANTVNFYVNSIHDGVSDVFSLLLVTTPSLMKSDQFDLSKLLPSNVPGIGTIYGASEWEFQSYNMASGSLYRYGGRVNSFSIASMSEVSLVPEPETYTMLLAGLGLMVAVVRRKQK